jgi:hypothetical protein
VEVYQIIFSNSKNIAFLDICKYLKEYNIENTEIEIILKYLFIIYNEIIFKLW